MDGNGRWARRRALKRLRGHREGAASGRVITEESARLGIGQLTLYALSWDNFHKRPEQEVRGLMRLLDRYLRDELPTMMKNNILLRTIGEIEEFPSKLRERIADTAEKTSSNTGMTLCLALNYGGRREIARAARLLAERVLRGELKPEDIDVPAFARSLFTGDAPDVDLLIRTGGDMRVSDFLLWQISYAEIYVTETFWPDFRVEQFHRALDWFAGRHRRFGAVEED
jgi:undecaprenyl diphosphate synthase